MFGWLKSYVIKRSSGKLSSDGLTALHTPSVCMGEQDWSGKVGQLHGECDYLLKFTLLNGRSFMVNGGVENCDSEAIYWRDRRGVLQSTCRRGVSDLEITWKMKGRITHWNWVKHFGFLRTDAGVDYYFDKTSIESVSLLKDLDLGKTGQCVVFHIKRKSIAGKPPMVAVKGYAGDDDCVEIGLTKAKAETVNESHDSHDTEDASSAQIGFVSRWFKEYHYGFLVNGRKSCYFKECDIFDQRLKESLGKGKIRQQVRYLPMPNRENRETPPVRVIEMMREETQNWAPLPTGDSDYDIGRRLMNDGKLEEAAEYFKKVLNAPDDVCRLSALRDLAETLNRGEPPEESAVEAFDLIEAHRGEFGEPEQPRFERMEILYLMKAKRYSDAKEKIKNYLLKIDAEPNQRRYYRSLLKVAEEKCLGTRVEMGQELHEVDRQENLIASNVNKIGLTELSNAMFGEVETYIGNYRSELKGEYEDLVLLIRAMREYSAQADYSGRKAAWLVVKDCKERIEPWLRQTSLDVTTEEGVVAKAILEIVWKIYGLIENDFSTFLKRDLTVEIHKTDSGGNEIDKDGKLWPGFSARFDGLDGLELEEVVVRGFEPGMQAGEIQKALGTIVCGQEFNFVFAYKPSQKVIDSGRCRLELEFSFCNSPVNGGVPVSGVCEWEIRQLPLIVNHYHNYLKHEAKGDYFVGRSDYLNLVKEQFLSPNGKYVTCFYGVHSCGKSTLMMNLEECMPDTCAVLKTIDAPDIDPSNPVEVICKRIIVGVKKILRQNHLWTDDNEKVLEEYAQNDFIGRVQEVCECLKKTGKSAMLRIDEFTVLYDKYVSGAWPRDSLVSVLTLFKETFAKNGLLYVVLSGQDNMMKFYDSFPEYFNALMPPPDLKPMRLNFLKKEEVRKLVNVGLSDESGEPLLDEEAFEEVWNLTGGWPILVQCLCARITLCKKYRVQITANDVLEASKTFYERGISQNKGLERERPGFFEAFVRYRTIDFDEAELLRMNHMIALQSGQHGAWVSLRDIQQEFANAKSLVKELDDRGLLRWDSEGKKMRLKVGLFAAFLRQRTIEEGWAVAEFGGASNE